MAFYFSQGNSAERIDDIRPPDQLSQATDDVRRSQNSNRRRADPRPAKQTSRREALRARLIGDQGSSDRTRAAHWQQTTTADPLSDTSEVLINSEGRVSYGTWHGLISYLTQVHRPSDTYTQAFFLTFRAFATPADLADALATRVRELAAVRAHSAGAQRTRQSILHNVFLAIKHWYDQYWWPHADAAVLPFLCSFLVNEYLPLSHGGAEAKECHQLLVRIAEKNDNVNLRALPTNGALKSMLSARKQPTDSQQLQLQRRRSESARKSRAYNEDSARPHSGGQDAGARDAARASGRPEPPESPRDSGSSQSEGSHGHHGFWSRLFGKLHRSSQSTRVHTPFSDSGSSLFASPDRSVPGNDDHDDMESVIPVQVLEPQPHKRRHLMHRQRDERDSGVQVSHDSESEPDISDLLMATVGMDLSLEAYRRNTHIYQISPVDVACQLTIIESSCYCQIEPYELVNKEFSRGSDSHAVNVRQMSR
ncbi:Ras guanine nucleotide exchange factor bud5, partial [Coemansia sp. RSA 2708]